MNLTTEETSFYTQIYTSLEPDPKGNISSQKVVVFLSSSRLNQASLFSIWQLVNADNSPQITQSQLNLSLKLIALVQTGKQPALSLLSTQTPLPIFDNSILSGLSSLPSISITPEEKDRYKQAFLSCNPVNGVTSTDASRGFFLKSGLSNDILGKIWSLVDINGNGLLSVEQFTIAMLIIMKIKTGSLLSVPNTIPSSLWVSVGSQPAARTSVTSHDSKTDIPLDSKNQFESFFDNLDTSRKGYLTGQETHAFFLKSKLPDSDLARIWNQCAKNGTLTKDDFVLAMWLIKQQLSGVSSLPTTLLRPSSSNPVDLLDFSSDVSGIR